MGLHSVGKLLSRIAEDAGIEHATNNSLRRTAISIMYELGIPEVEIARRSRHKSIEALRDYMRCSQLSC